MMELARALDWAATRRTGVLITLRKDGRAQSSDVAYTVRDGAFIVSLTDDRAKTRNMRRDNRVVLHITDPPSWSYLSFDATAELSAVTARPGDPASDALVDYFRAVTGTEHPDWDEYRTAMVEEKRLICTIGPTGVVGQINS